MITGIRVNFPTHHQWKQLQKKFGCEEAPQVTFFEKLSDFLEDDPGLIKMQFDTSDYGLQIVYGSMAELYLANSKFMVDDNLGDCIVSAILLIQIFQYSKIPGNIKNLANFIARMFMPHLATEMSKRLEMKLATFKI